jgi:transcriptional regulator with XRE-family HTH domain
MPDIGPIDSTADLRRLASMIADARKRRGLTIRQLAGLASVSHTYLNILEDGADADNKPSRPGEDIVRRIALALTLEVDSLLELAGYQTNIQPTVAAQLEGGTPPGMFEQLPFLESDLAANLDKTVVEIPIFCVLKYFDDLWDRNDDTPKVRILGQAFKAGTLPARLYAASGNEKLADRQRAALARGPGHDFFDKVGVIRIAVFGLYMTPTVLLLRQLNRVGLNVRLHTSDFKCQIADVLERYSTVEPVHVELQVVYSSDNQSLLLGLGKQGADLALFVHPFTQVELARELSQDRFRDLNLDLWTDYRTAGLPMNLIVCTQDTIERDEKLVASRLLQLGANYQGLHADLQKQARDRLTTETTADPPAVGSPRNGPVLDVFRNPYIDDVASVADDLSLLHNLGRRLGLLRHQVPARIYEDLITDGATLRSGKSIISTPIPFRTSARRSA